MGIEYRLRKYIIAGAVGIALVFDPSIAVTQHSGNKCKEYYERFEEQYDHHKQRLEVIKSQLANKLDGEVGKYITNIHNAIKDAFERDVLITKLLAKPHNCYMEFFNRPLENPGK